MFGLNFYPHTDSYHSTFRAICIASATGHLPIDGYRIVDYFLLFPFDLRILRLRGGNHKKLAQKYDAVRPYKWTPDPASTFLNMREFQDIAIQTLVNRKILSPAAFEKGTVSLSKGAALAGILKNDLDQYLGSRRDVFDFLLDILSKEGVTGPNGIKARSGLMPFKYDVKSDVILD